MTLVTQEKILNVGLGQNINVIDYVNILYIH